MLNWNRFYILLSLSSTRQHNINILYPLTFVYVQSIANNNLVINLQWSSNVFSRHRIATDFQLGFAERFNETCFFFKMTVHRRLPTKALDYK